MTDQQRKEGRSLTETSSAVKAAFANYRIVDPIRKTALECAVRIVESAAPRPDESDTARATRVLHIATILEEEYLTGEEANGQ